MAKVAPPPEAPGLTYEVDLLATEALFYERAATLDVPLPSVVAAGDGWLVVTRLDGTPANQAAPAPAAALALRRDLGGHVARLHSLRGDGGFGYPQLPLAPTWREAFGVMVRNVLADAERFGVDLEVGAEDLDGDDLDEVATPVLVHFDLWDGNLFVDPVAGRVTGIIDAERAFWGDPLADFASLPVFGDTEQDAALLEGYRAAGGTLDFTAGERTRIARYRAYLDLLMLTETVPRQVGPEADDLVAFVRQHLDELLSTQM